MTERSEVNVAIEKIIEILCEHFDVKTRHDGHYVAAKILSLFHPNLPPSPWTGQEKDIVTLLEKLHNYVYSYWLENYPPMNTMSVDNMTGVITGKLASIESYNRLWAEEFQRASDFAKKAEKYKNLVTAYKIRQSTDAEKEVIKLRREVKDLKHQMSSLVESNNALFSALSKREMEERDT